MIKLEDILTELGISHYLYKFLELGFDTWETIIDIKESDFETIGVKLGHRRKLQRKIASLCGIAPDQALPIIQNISSNDQQSENHHTRCPTLVDKDRNRTSHRAKRTYKRRPMVDRNAPERPYPAYVLFSIQIREENEGKHLSFTEVAKIIGKKWQNLTPEEKRSYEQQAFAAKERFKQERLEYQKTANHKEYSQYLADFEARHPRQQQLKNSKLDASTTESSTDKSGISEHDSDTQTSKIPIDSTISRWDIADAILSPNMSSPQRSPNITALVNLPVYYRSDFDGPQQTLPWRDALCNHNVNFLHPVTVSSDRQSYSASIPDKSDLVMRWEQTLTSPPQSLTSEPINRPSILETSPDRALTLPPICPQRSATLFENKIPSLSSFILSTGSTTFNSQ